MCVCVCDLLILSVTDSSSDLLSSAADSSFSSRLSLSRPPSSDLGSHAGGRRTPAGKSISTIHKHV